MNSLVDLDDGLVATVDEFIHQIGIPIFRVQASINEVILQEYDEIHNCDDTSWPDQPLGHSDGMDSPG
jgi:hypothetical protein